MLVIKELSILYKILIFCVATVLFVLINMIKNMIKKLINLFIKFFLSIPGRFILLSKGIIVIEKNNLSSGLLFIKCKKNLVFDRNLCERNNNKYSFFEIILILYKYYVKLLMLRNLYNIKVSSDAIYISSN